MGDLGAFRGDHALSPVFTANLTSAHILKYQSKKAVMYKIGPCLVSVLQGNVKQK